MGDGEERSEEEVLEEVADKALDQDNSSVLKKDALVETIRYAFGKIHYSKRPELINQYNENAISRREFLKFLGFGTGSAFATYFGLGYFIERRHLDEPVESVTGYAAGDTFNVESDGSLSPGGNLNQVINSNQGKNIVVPEEEYTFNGAIEASGNTQIMFEGTTINPPDGNHRMFNCSGNGWHIGGDLDILQEERNYCNVSLRGEGQFGDDQGRISWIGRIPEEHIPLKKDRFASQFPNKEVNQAQATNVLLDSGSGTIRLMNIDQLGPVESRNDAQFTWTDRSGRLELIGLNIHSFNDNLFYIKQMQGEFVARNCYFKDNNVAAVRTGANGGTTLENCCVVATDRHNPGLTAAGLDSSVNHSCLSIESGDSNIGNITLRGTHYDKRGGGGQFLRDMGSAQHANVTVEDCQWTGYPDNITIPSSSYTLQGDNGGNPSCEPPEGAVEGGGTTPGGGSSGGRSSGGGYSPC